MVVPWADVNLVRLPNEMESHRAASLGCRFVTSFGGLVDQARVAPGETVVVYGFGGVGLSAVMSAAGAGARIIAVDIREEKLVRPRRGDPLDEKRAGVGVRRTAPVSPETRLRECHRLCMRGVVAGRRLLVLVGRSRGKRSGR